jgi:hypothetical protein
MANEKVPAPIPGMESARSSFFDVCLGLYKLHQRLESTKLVSPAPPEVHYDRAIEAEARKGLDHIRKLCDDLARFVEPLGSPTRAGADTESV